MSWFWILLVIVTVMHGVAWWALDFRTRRIERKLGIKDDWDPNQ